MKKVGGTLMFFGVAAIVLNFINYAPRLLMWIYNWGEGPAWGIKIALVVLGAILYFSAKETPDTLGNNNTPR
ncbi:MAG: hypothetical protein WBP45_00675 [Daejeonella sp.]